jgi:hypothetical protein
MKIEKNISEEVEMKGRIVNLEGWKYWFEYITLTFIGLIPTPTRELEPVRQSGSGPTGPDKTGRNRIFASS